MATTKPFVSPSLTYETLEETLDVKPRREALYIGIPKEDSFNENRIALTPDAVSVIVANGHEVCIETNAGEGANYTDNDYSEAGAKICYDKAQVFEADIIVKSAPVSIEECELLKMNQTIISPIHLAEMKREILEKMMQKKITALSFENLKDDSGHNPIVRSMSEIAGSAVMLIAGQYLSNANNGKGVLVGGISGIPPTKVIIIGAGIVGEYAARTALAMGASVKIFDNSIYRLKRLQNNIGGRLWTSVIEPKILAKQLKTCDVAVGALGNDGALHLW
jgi:alanine dehydrogenase